MFVVFRSLPMGPKLDPRASSSAGEQPSGPNILAGLRLLVGSFEAVSFFLVVFVLGCVSGAPSAMLPLDVRLP
jgi:hypothetical protein